jgi:hypothetical protein
MQPTIQYNTLERKPGHGGDKYPAFPPDVLWVAFSIPPGSLSLVKYPVVKFTEVTRYIFDNLLVRIGNDDD